MSINLRIKDLRKEKKLSQKDFAVSIGVDESQYSKIERGLLQPTINQIVEICSTYKVSADWIVIGANITTSDQHNRDAELLQARLDIIDGLKFKVEVLEKRISELNKENPKLTFYDAVAEPAPELITKR